MEVGPYIRPRTVVHSRRKICDMCKYCNAHKIYGRKKTEVISATCKHPNVAESAPSFGRFLSDYLEHDELEVFTPDWCPAEKKTNHQNAQD